MAHFSLRCITMRHRLRELQCEGLVAVILTGDEDIRIRKTIKAIRGIFEEMLLEMPYEKITVKALCDRALINKTTFYRYYPTLEDLLDVLGDRKLSLCRELTKLNEEIIRITLSGAVKLYEEKEPRGEYVLIIEGAPDETDAFWLDMTEEEHVGYYMSLGQSKNEAMKSAAKDRGVGKSEIYNKIMKKD